MQFIDILGLVAGICTSSSLVPQLVKTVKNKKAQDVSVFMFIVMLTGNALWLYYGFHKKDIAIIATNSLSVILNTLLLICKYKYRNNK